MRWIDLLHRWTGGLIGLLLAVLGLSGAVLVWRDSWTLVPHAGDALVRDPAAIADATAAMLRNPQPGQSVVYASERFGVHQLRLGEGAGAYADQSGRIVERWSSQWQRPELWLADLHHHLFAGEVGETIIGIAGLCAVFFIVTGVILWWRTRKSFRWRLLPRRLSRPAIVMHHRDLGIVMAPLLFLSSITGAAMIFRPVALATIAPFGSPAKAMASLKPAKVAGGSLKASVPWTTIVATAARRFPDASPRIMSLPKRAGDPIVLRMRRSAEWLPNGRTTLSFDAADGRLLAATDALAVPRGAWIFTTYFPIHAAKVGGLGWRLVMTLSGLALGLLGSLAVWSFWFKRSRRRVCRAP